MQPDHWRSMAAGTLTALSLIFLTLLLPCHEARGKPPRPKCWSTYRVEGSSPDTMQPCYYNMCRCDAVSVDCSSSHMTYVPLVSSNVKFLNMSNSRNRGNENQYFTNISLNMNVEVLDIYNNNLAGLVLGPLRFRYKLKRVLMGGNRMGYPQLESMLHAGPPRLRSLELKCGGLGNIPKGLFVNNPCPRLRYIDMSWNSIEILDMKVFQPVRKLETLLLRYNKIEHVVSAHHPALSKWFIRKNGLKDFPDTCDRNGTSMYPNLTLLDLSFNSISELSKPVCLPRLAKLTLNFNEILYFFKDMFSLERFPSLRFLGLTQMKGKIKTMEEFTFNNSGLLEIEFGHNNVDFALPEINTGVFRGCHHLQKLFLDGNNFHDVNSNQFRSLLDHLSSSMEVLYLGKTGLKQLGVDMFENFIHLRELYIYENRIQSIPDKVFDRLNLTVLKMSRNPITTVSHEAFSEETRNRLQYIDLSGDHYDCDCGIQHLKQWMRKEPNKFHSYRQIGYKCYRTNTTVQEVFISSTTCLLLSGRFWKIVLTCFIPALFGLLRVYRNIRARLVGRRTVQQHFPYHVYAVHSEGPTDSEWVKVTLRPELERWGLTVRTSDDIPPGRAEVATNDKFLLESHSVVLVLTSELASEYSEPQMTTYYDQAARMTEPRAFVVIAKPDLDPEQNQHGLFRQLKDSGRATWLVWGGEENDSSMACCLKIRCRTEETDRKGRPTWETKFWEDLREALKGTRRQAEEDNIKQKQN